MTNYRVTEGCVLINKREYRRGAEFADGSPEVNYLGPQELQRLIGRGWLEVVGLKPGLERGTIAPDHEPLPSEVVMADAAGHIVHGANKLPSPGPTPLPDTGSEQVVEDTAPAAQARLDAQEQARLDREAAAKGQPRGKWLADPASMADKNIDQLNALIQAVEPGIPLFEAGDEADAVAFLSQNFQAPAEAPKDGVQVSGDADASSTKNAVVG